MLQLFAKSEAFVVCSSHADGQKLYSHVGIVFTCSSSSIESFFFVS